MNVADWNRFADLVLRWLLERGLVSAVVLAAAFAAFFLLRRRVRLTAPLFAAALVLLVLPVERLLPARLTVAPIARPVEALAARVGPPPVVVDDVASQEIVLTGAGGVGAVAPVDARTGTSSTPAADRPTTGAWLLLGWSAVVGLLLVGLIRNELRARRVVRCAVPVDGALADECERLRRRVGIRRPVLLAETDALASPATAGFRRPVIVLPRGLAKRLTRDERRWVLLHELQHVRRGDVLTQFGQRLVQIAWWFDPFVWLANRMVDRQRECLCDDDALRRLDGETRTDGARAFVKVLESSQAAPALPGLVGLWNEKRFVRQRLVRLLEDPSRPVGRAARSLALLLVAAAALPAARALVGPAPQDEEVEEVVATEGGASAAAIGRALEWLVRQQEEDGRWVAGPAKHRSHSGMNDVGVTALATMALLGAPPSARTVAVDDAISASVAYLLAIQDEVSGQLGDRVGVTYVYNHGYATLALARARAARPSAIPVERLQHAVRFIERARNPYHGWRYSHVPDGDNDTSVTGLMLHALSAARDAGAEVEESAFEAGLAFLDEMTDEESGRTGYLAKGRWSARLPETAEPFPPELTEAMTAVALSARMNVGVDPAASTALLKSFARLAARPPEWSGGGVDFYYWWYGTEAMRRFGGALWTGWRTKLVDTLVARQVTGGDAAGSWPADDAWSGLGGRVYATALNALSLQGAL